MMRRSAAWFLIGIFLLSGCVASQDTAGDMQQDSGQETVTLPEDENENGEMNMTSANRQIRVTAEDGGEIIFELNESTAASDLYGQLPLSVEIEDFSDNEKIFYPEELDTSDTPLAEMEIGTLAYYEPWGDVVMFYGEYSENSSLYELGHVVSGGELIPELAGTVEIEAVQ